MNRAFLAAGILALAGTAQAQQVRSACAGAVEVSANYRFGGGGFEYTLSLIETAQAPGRLLVQVEFQPPPPARAAPSPVPVFEIAAGARREVVIGYERRTGARPSLERERILDFVTIACGRPR